MLNPAYSISKFSENISQKSSISEVKNLIQATKSTLQVGIKSLPLDFSWDAGLDQITGSASISLFPKLWLNGELYQASHWKNIAFTNFATLEHAFMTTLKDSLFSLQHQFQHNPNHGGA